MQAIYYTQKGGNRRMTTKERFTVSSDKILSKIKELIHQGNIRKVRLINDGKTIIEMPVTIGAPVAAAGILIAPLLAAIGAFAALVTETTIEVEREEESGSENK
jgi:hypothetical protein